MGAISCNGAILALLLHCVTNVHLHHGDHLPIEYLRDTKEVLLLLQVTSGLDMAAVVGTFFRDGNDKVHLHQITKHCKVLPPIVIAKEYNGVFNPHKGQRRATRN
jgi:hypothetical protein